MTILDLLDNLDGYGLILTDEDDLLDRLRELRADLDADVPRVPLD